MNKNKISLNDLEIIIDEHIKEKAELCIVCDEKIKEFIRMHVLLKHNLVPDEPDIGCNEYYVELSFYKDNVAFYIENSHGNDGYKSSDAMDRIDYLILNDMAQEDVWKYLQCDSGGWYFCEVEYPDIEDEYDPELDYIIEKTNNLVGVGVCSHSAFEFVKEIYETGKKCGWDDCSLTVREMLE